MKKLLSYITIAITLVCLFALSACNKESGVEYNGWSVVEQRLDGNSQGSALENYASFSLASIDGNRKIKEVWLNVSGLKNDEAVVNLTFANSSQYLSPMEFSQIVKKSDLKTNDGWVKLLSEPENVAYSYFELCVTESMTLNEVVLVTTTDKKLALTLTEMGQRPNRGSNSAIKYTQVQIETAITEGTLTTSALNLIDEQDKFKIEG